MFKLCEKFCGCDNFHQWDPLLNRMLISNMRNTYLTARQFWNAQDLVIKIKCELNNLYIYDILFTRRAELLIWR